MGDEDMSGVTHWALEALGLDADADERAVKRAYAARLKTTRPDSDPEGFQRLHAAYQAALEWGRTERDEDAPPSRRASRLADDTATPLPAIRMDAAQWQPLNGERQADADAAIGPSPLRAQPFDPAALLPPCIDQAVNALPDAFAAWLQACPELWSLRDKATFGRLLLQHLAAEVPPIRSDNMLALIAFFAIDDVHSGYDARQVTELRFAMQAVWDAEQILQGSARIALGSDRRGRPVYGRAHGQSRIEAAQAQRRIVDLRRFARQECPELLGRWWWPSMFWRALSRSRREGIVAALEGLDIDALPEGFDRNAARLWRESEEPQRLSWGRLFVALSVTLGCWITLMIPLVTLALPALFEGEPPIPLLMLPTLIVFPLFGLWLALQASRRLVLWQAGPDPAPGPMRWLHRGLTPALLAATLALGLIEREMPLRMTPLPFLLVLVICRLHIRHSTSLPGFLYRLTEHCEEWLHSSSYGLVMLFSVSLGTAIAIAIASVYGSLVPTVHAVAGLILMLWVWDLLLSIRARRDRA